MKKIVCLFFLISFSGFAQSINDYQYVLVPQKFSFQKSNDEFHLNTTAKFMLQKYGFKSFFSSDSIAKDLANENCNKLYAEVEKESSFLMTKVKLLLKDCHGKIFFETQYGTSREKEYLVSYNEALRNAFKSFDQLNYKYYTNSTTLSTSLENINNGILCDGNWHHIVISYNSTGVYAYYDGAFKMSSTNILPPDSRNSFSIGKNYAVTSNNSSLYFAEFRYYNKYLSSLDVYNVYNSSIY